MKFPAIVKKQNERMIAYPRNTEEVSNIVKFSNKNGLNIIPLGGETNRVDGTKPDQKSKPKLTNKMKKHALLTYGLSSIHKMNTIM